MRCSLRTLLIAQYLILIAIMPIAATWRRNHQEEGAIAKVHELGGVTEFVDEPASTWSFGARRCRSISMPFADLSSVDLAFLAEMRSLESLNLQHTGIGDEQMRAIGRCTELRELYVYQCHITDEGVRYIASLKGLTNLGLSGNPITDEGVAHLAQLPALRDLRLDRCDRLTDETLRCLAGAPQLASLVLSSELLTDEGLRRLPDFPELRELQLCGAFTATGLGQVTFIGKLEQFYVYGTDSSVKGLGGIRTPSVRDGAL